MFQFVMRALRARVLQDVASVGEMNGCGRICRNGQFSSQTESPLLRHPGVLCLWGHGVVELLPGRVGTLVLGSDG